MSTPAEKPDEKLSDGRLGEPSGATRERAEAARERQRIRFEGSSGMVAKATRLPRKRWPGRGARPLPGGRGGSHPAAGGDAAVAHERPSLPPHPQAVPDHRRPFVGLRAGLAGSESIETVYLAEAIQ